MAYNSAREVPADTFADSDSENDYFRLELSDSDKENSCSSEHNNFELQLQVMTQTSWQKLILMWVCCLQTKYVFFPLEFYKCCDFQIVTKCIWPLHLILKGCCNV